MRASSRICLRYARRTPLVGESLQVLASIQAVLADRHELVASLHQLLVDLERADLVQRLGRSGR